MPHTIVGQPEAASVARSAVDALGAAILAAQRSDGGWGAEPARPSNTEATSYGVVALALAGASAQPAGAAPAAVARGVRWLTSHQHADGSWPATEQVPAPSWMSSVAVLGLALTGAAPAAARRGARWLLAEEGVRFDWRTRLALWLERRRGGKREVEVDVELKGWPWASGTFTWVEPTAVAMLALRAMSGDPALADSRDRRYRLEQGEKLLADRMVPGGGWNYGNSRVLDEDLEPYPDTTAWALLALRAAPPRDVVEPSLAALARLMTHNESPLARALALLALRAYGRDATALAGALAAQCGGERLPNDARTRALALLALSSSSFPFSGAPPRA